MAEPMDRKTQVKQWMVRKFRERLRSAKVDESLERWLGNMDATMTMRFEFVLNDETAQVMKNPDRAPGLGEEKV